MISLKKNDKIIIIAAVVILVIAGIGIAMYQAPETLPEDFYKSVTAENKTTVTWTLHNGSLTSINEFAGKKAPYETTVSIPDANINSVTFNLTWTDDRMTILKRMGLDTLTLDVTMPDGSDSSGSSKSAPKTGFGSVVLTIPNHIIPPKQEMNTNRTERFTFDDSWTDKDIKINVSCQIGEMRFLKKLRDKGNDFMLEITYQYYQGSYKNDGTINTGTDPEMPPDDIWQDEEKPPYLSMIISTGCARYI